MDKSLEELGKVKVFVEADDIVQMYFQVDSRRPEWRYASSGCSADVGYLELLGGDSQPVHVKWFIHHHKEQPVCFYYATSVVVDYRKIRAFFTKYGQKGCNFTTILNVDNFLDRS